MEVYFLLLAIIYIVYFFSRFGKSEVRNNKLFLFIVFFLIYLLCVWRDFSIGRDIPGYKEIYEYTDGKSFFDASWTYMEWGYVLLMKLCTYLGLTFRQFFYLIYLIMLAPIGVSIYRYSEDVLLSVIIFVCYQFLLFDMSALRQGLATSICLLSIPFAETPIKSKWKYFFIIVFLAFLIHRSAAIFIAVFFIIRLKFDLRALLIVIASSAFAMGLRTSLLYYLQDTGVTSYQFNEESYLGMSLLFLILIVAFSVITLYLSKNYKSHNKRKFLGDASLDLTSLSFLMVFSVITSLLFNGSTLLRASMYYIIFMIFLLPNTIDKYASFEKSTINIIFHILMVAIFYFLNLIPDSFDQVPYLLSTSLWK